MSEPQTVVLSEYVKSAFDSVLDDFDYLADAASRDAQQKDAVSVIREALELLSCRPLNQSEMVKLVMFVALEWQRRRERAEEAAFDRAEGKLWRNAETPLTRTY